MAAAPGSVAGLVRFDFEFQGDDIFARRLSVAADAVQDFRPVFKQIAHETRPLSRSVSGTYRPKTDVNSYQYLGGQHSFIGIEKEQFKARGARGPHGRWPTYDEEPRYRARKARILGLKTTLWRMMPELRWVAAWQDAPADGERLYPALVDPKSPYHRFHMEPLQMEVGPAPSIDYAGRHQLGQGNQPWDDIPIPRRRPVDLTPDDVHAWVKAIQRYIHVAVDIRGVRSLPDPRR